MRILLLVSLFLSVHIYGEETSIFDPQLNNTSWIINNPKDPKDKLIYEFNDQFFISKLYVKEKLQDISTTKISWLQKINNLYFLYGEDYNIPLILEINNDLLYVYHIDMDNTNISALKLKQHTKESAQ
ncbi:MAG: hypothetical protein ACRCVW_04255 [Brevinema sp.]